MIFFALDSAYIVCYYTAQTDLGISLRHGDSMTNKWALGALVLTLGMAACNTAADKPGSSTAVAAPLTENDRKVIEVETELGNFKRLHELKTGWAAKVQPGDYRATNDIQTSLGTLDALNAKLDGVPANDKVGGMRGEIRSLMMADCALLLRKTRAQQDIWALGAFVQYASRLDTKLDMDFGVTEDGLKAEALAMAKKYVLENRARGWNSDTHGGLMQIYNVWLFTPQQLGLTADEAKIVLER